MPKPLNVLILEDNPSDAELLLVEIRRAGYEPVWQVVDNEKDFLSHLEPGLDIILSDYSLPQFTGLEALSLLKKSGYDVPLILISGTIGEEIAVECMRQGADDYLMKDRLARLGTAIENALNKKVLQDEKKQADQALLESTEYQKAIFETTSVATAIIGEDTTVLMVNREFEKLSGYSKDKLEGKKKWTDFVVTEDLNKMMEYHQKRRKDPDSVEKVYEFRAITKERGIKTILLNVDIIPGTKQSVISLLDISDRKKAEQELMDSEQKFKWLYINAPIAYHILSKDGVITDVNQKWCDVLKYSKEEVIGKRIFDFINEEERQAAKKSFQDKIISQQKYFESGKRNYCTKTGEIKTFKTFDFFVLDETDQISSVQTTIQDITDNELADKKLVSALDGTIHVAAAMVELRDPYTAGHQASVAELAAAIAVELDLPEEQVEGIRLGGIIHDLGKIQIPAEILSKPGQLNDLEFDLIKTHPQVGYNLLREIEFPWPLAEIVFQHHEKMNGSGYPRGLKGEGIMLEARILVVADIVEAMSSHRPYRPALGIEAALDQIRQDRGTLLDPEVVDACLKIFKEGYKFSG